MQFINPGLILISGGIYKPRAYLISGGIYKLHFGFLLAGNNLRNHLHPFKIRDPYPLPPSR
jgi:hypothetical protein